MTREIKDSLSKLLPEGRILFEEPMSRHSTMGVGGPAEAFVIAKDTNEIKRLIGWATDRGVEYCFWGGGSNTLVKDGGIRGVVIKLGEGLDSIDILRKDGDDVFVRVGAATPTARFVKWAAGEGLSGALCLAGVWGTIGGNIMTNAGAGGGSIGDVIHEITIINREGKELSIKKTALRFEYRRLKMPRTAAVTHAVLHLVRRTPQEVSTTIEESLKRRDETQPKGRGSLGCIFRNPGKTSAGMLIDEAGLKGVRIGGARISPAHANFIVNEGSATARDIIVLINLVRERVREQTGISLELEIEIIGNET